MTVLDSRTLLERHVAAFNDRDVLGLLGDLAEDAEWVTGKYSCRGHAELRELFEGAFDAVVPRLEVVRVVPAGDVVAAELVEHMLLDGHPMSAAIAGFYAVRDGRIAKVKIYREGSADIPGHDGE
ncbi:nuclear transport factor 2 family protein [Flexivirga oryzae]|uniref:Ketosteroid isomerase-like protein n=1 Tax=Flexivirga oryzae TaxID=1794944 RepID=A0A839N0T0_9MICO|nr:nuclear transport factor 2 family protein [Flexivirga oryzae]MBB2890429.1 ketosteroid isomerase-like protein [Flexivirga oryzae]